MPPQKHHMIYFWEDTLSNPPSSCRLTPTYMFVLLFYAKLMGFLGEGPVWYTQQQNPTCDKYWWTNLLYINNFYPTTLGKEVCD